jgi:hypothetical protein
MSWAEYISPFLSTLHCVVYYYWSKTTGLMLGSIPVDVEERHCRDWGATNAITVSEGNTKAPPDTSSPTDECLGSLLPFPDAKNEYFRFFVLPYLSFRSYRTISCRSGLRNSTRPVVSTNTTPIPVCKAVQFNLLFLRRGVSCIFRNYHWIAFQGICPTSVRVTLWDSQTSHPVPEFLLGAPMGTRSDLDFRNSKGNFPLNVRGSKF